MFSHSDIVSFHCYDDKKTMEQKIKAVKRFDRPMICTEYMARPFKSTFQDILPLLKKHNIGAYSWGLVAGKTQTHCPWDSWNVKYENEPELWFHEIFNADGSPYKPEEVAFLQGITKENKRLLDKVA
jgi:hypothetical protein